jgi:hypothetical protein
VDAGWEEATDCIEGSECVANVTDPRADPGSANPGADPGSNPGADPGANPGVDPGADPGTNPGAVDISSSSKRWPTASSDTLVAGITSTVAGIASAVAGIASTVAAIASSVAGITSAFSPASRFSFSVFQKSCNVTV